MGEEGRHRMRCGRRGARASFLPGSGESNKIFSLAATSKYSPASTIEGGTMQRELRSTQMRNQMSKTISAIAIESFALLLGLGTAYQAVAQTATTASPATPYSKMARVA